MVTHISLCKWSIERHSVCLNEHCCCHRSPCLRYLVSLSKLCLKTSSGMSIWKKVLTKVSNTFYTKLSVVNENRDYSNKKAALKQKFVLDEWSRWNAVSTGSIKSLVHPLSLWCMTHEHPYSTTDLYLSHLCVTVLTDPHSHWSRQFQAVTEACSIRGERGELCLSLKALLLQLQVNYCYRCWYRNLKCFSIMNLM